MIIKLKNILLNQAIQEIQKYMEDNPENQSISKLMDTLHIEPSIIIQAVEKLIEIGVVEEI